MLAALPVRLAPGEPAAEPAARLSPVRVMLATAWGSVLLAAAAVGMLLRAAISLSERRGAFVSAVTHELRTPLTTFRMYTEMLAEKMVPDEQKREHYLNTLRTEADRLGHLVENVLAYARLERGPATRDTPPVRLGELLERTGQRLRGRAAQAGMELVVEADDDARATLVRANGSAVEQILFNLVDNACKYASAAGDRRIHLEAGCADGTARIRVRDHGPGIPPGERSRIFRPFRKSAHEAADTAPGVGLGLALSRRLALSMGSDLDIDGQTADGACFVLTLRTDVPS
jgi:signal transduction histidine kinase